MPPSREHRMTFPKLSDNCPWTNSWTNLWTKFCKMPISSRYHFFTFYGQKKSCKPEFIGFTAFILLWDQQGSKMSTKALKAPSVLRFRSPWTILWARKSIFYLFNTYACAVRSRSLPCRTYNSACNMPPSRHRMPHSGRAVCSGTAPDQTHHRPVLPPLSHTS